MKVSRRNRLIVVLGMHRSGTSAVARGLLALQVELGDRLIGPIPGNNDRGFWEDAELNTLDNEILGALGSDWHFLSPLSPAQIETLREAGFFLRAAELLRAKVGRHPLYGIKDPRLAKLLPFWKKVFAYRRLDTSYVLTLRHPTSVARSLEKRDGIEPEKSYLLWLAHVIESLRGTLGSRRVLVDYDRLMQDPERELRRVAAALGLGIDAGALAAYKSDFLDESLRHTSFDLHDLALEDACPPLVREVYAAMLQAASDRTSLAARAFQQKVAGWSRELARLAPTLHLADKLATQNAAGARALAESRGRLEQLSQGAAEREAGQRNHVAQLETAVGERDARIAGLLEAAAGREAGHQRHAADLERAVAEREGQLARLTAVGAERERGFRQHAVDLEKAVGERDARISSLQQAAAERECGLQKRVGDLEKTVGERDARISSLQQAAAGRDARIADAAQAAAERELHYRSHVADLETAVGGRDAQMAERELHYRSHVAELETAVGARDAQMAERELGYRHHVADLEKAVFAEQQARALQTAELERQLRAMRSSIYWKMTAHLRATERFVVWALKAFRARKTPPAPAAASAAAAPPPLPAPAAGQPGLPVADGRWEWADHDGVKERIRMAKTARGAFKPVPADLIELAGEPPARAAQRILLPDPGASPEVSIIVPVFNNLKLTVECLLSIARHAEASVQFEVIVADDASTDGSAEALAGVGHLRLARNGENLGFLRNCNRALGLVRGRYVLFLNNDAQVTQGWLKALLDTFARYPRAGAVGPRLLYPNGRLQEAGGALRPDGGADMVGLNEDPAQPRYAYARRVDYVSGACLMAPAPLLRELGGFSDAYAPCYCEDSDLCLRIEQAGYDVYYNPAATVVHHLSKTTAATDDAFKMRCVAANLATLARNWAPRFAQAALPRVLAFYLPQFHPFPENNRWWGEGFTEWTNVAKARPNFIGHDQPRLPADLGHYDLRLPEVMARQAELAQRYGIHGFCFHYYWFAGKRLLEAPLERMLASGKPDLPFCLCWANENWTRRWDGRDQDILMAQAHSPEDDLAVIADLARYFRDARYIRVDGRPLLLVYRVTLFPDFAATAARWRAWCRDHGIGEIYLALVESFELVHAGTQPSVYGCDAAVEFPPQELAEPKAPSGAVTNPAFEGRAADYRDLAVRFATRPLPPYTRFMGLVPGWDNTPRSQNRSFCFEHATPGAFQAWLEEAIEQTRLQHYGDERLIFVNAWNEWAESAYLEPDRRFGHSYLEAVRNALDSWLLR